MNARAAAARVMLQVIAGRSLSDSLPSQLAQFTDARDRALLQAICFGVCRWYFRLQEILEKLVDKPLKQKDMDIHVLLLIGLYQLIDMRIPSYAVVSETVNAAKTFKKIWAKNLINGVLREYQRRADEFKKIDFISHPRWLIEKFQQNYPNEWEAIVHANNQFPPFALRVNQRKLSRENYLQKINALPIPHTSSGIVLSEAMEVEKIPGFAEGEISVQDGAAQLAAELLQLTEGLRVLDACAAPGGKTAHLLEIANVDCVAMDKNADRLKQVDENCRRLHLSATLITADAGDIKTWWDGRLFDRVLLDAPCSASGIIRRHPDIKLLRRPADIALLAKEQLRLLEAVWTVLKSDGLLVYATCSIFPEENYQIIQKFIEKHPEAREEKITAEWGIPCPLGRQILPGQYGMDGFYYACLRK